MDIKDIRPRSSIGCRLFTHLLTILLLFLGTLGIFLVLFYGAPLPANSSPETSEIDHRWWLLEIVDERFGRLSGPTPPRPTPIITYPPSVPTYVSPGNRPFRRNESMTNALSNLEAVRHERSVETSKKVYDLSRRDFDGRKMYGFGVWGWCGWYRDDELGEAQCHTEAFWQLPNDAPSNDPLSVTDLPDIYRRSLRHSLSVAGFLLVFPAFTGAIQLISLIVAFASPPLWPILRGGIPSFYPPEETTTGTWLHHLLINTFRAVLVFINLLAFGLPVSIVTWIAVGKMDSDLRYPGISASPGLGFWLLIGSCILFALATVLPVIWGLRIHEGKAAK